MTSLKVRVLAEAGTPFPGSAFPSPLYRIPALTQTKSGRIIAAFDVRSDWRDLPAEFDIALRVSDDLGHTWSEPRALHSHSEGFGVGDASLLTDPLTGRVFCWHVGSHGESFFSAKVGGPGLELWLSYSDDEGETWTHRDLSELRPENVGGMFTSSGNGAIGADGTLYQPFVCRVDEESYACIAASRDHGETWVLGELVGPDCDENKVIEVGNTGLGAESSGVSSTGAQLGEGTGSRTLLMLARARPLARLARSTDAGRTFTEAVAAPALVDPSCNGGIARLGNLLVVSLPDHPSERTRLSLRISGDGGVTWSEAILVDPGAAAYSDLIALADGSLALAWETDDYQRILFARIEAEELGIEAGTGSSEDEDAQRGDEDAWLSGEGVRGGDEDARDGGVGAEIRNEGVQGGAEGALGGGEGRQSVGAQSGNVGVRGVGTWDGGAGVQSGNEGSRGGDVNPRYVPAHTPPEVSVSSEANALARSGVCCGAKVFAFSMEKASLQPRGVPGAFAKPPVITGESVSFLQK
ncbi:neuramidase [Schaalia cardiffensis F0333]|uniref:exo-alpha-sialidase n=1 Tax=Schaalia cardiffensis F0333 TaxID=888050 RepID=N6X8G3_9ACTO|nr:sialidase family protein [Schaalia cardiffensis]ENO17453.1 neuramidase [Schaalia cardiffensis F0333]